MWHRPQLESLSASKLLHMVNGGFSLTTKIRSAGSVMRVKTLKTVQYNIGNIHLETRVLPSIELTSKLTVKHSEIKAMSLVSQLLFTTPCMQFGNIYHRSYPTMRPKGDTIRPFTLNICCGINQNFK
ncbi:uncharacterized protein LOC117099810, partial [Anneissia japonica]|uniref:uncharacterized protein LOC117099810 n=1 Tax=Anneissia japonica TaxID=1529436 RepID=UPI0014254BF8